MGFNVNTKKSLRSRSVHTVLNLLIPELVPWGRTSGSKNQGKPLICSATWTRLLRAYTCLCRIKRDERREAGARVAWRLHKYLFSEVSNRTCPFRLIWRFLLWCNGRREPETYHNLPSEWELSDSAPMDSLGGKAAFLVCSRAIAAYAALGAAGHRLPNRQHLCALF